MSRNSTILLVAALLAFSLMFVLIKLFRIHYCTSKRNTDAARTTGLFLADVANRPCYELIEKAIKTGMHEGSQKAPSCPVCLETFSRSGQKCKRLHQCGHAFHVDCVDPWLITSPHCPLCRADVKNAVRKEEHATVVISMGRDSPP